MPTIIDSLVVELSLDPAKMTAGQRRAVESLRAMERQAALSARIVSDATGKGLIAFYANVDQHFTQANQHLAQIAAQSRRTGSAVGAGGKEAAAGIATLTTASLAAYAALKALHGLYGSVTSTAAAGASTGRIAQEISGGSGWIQQFSNAAKVSVNANPEAVREDLRTLTLDIEALKSGVWNERFSEMSKGGVNWVTTDTTESLMRKIEDNLAAKSSPSEAAMWATRYGLSRDTGRAARQGSSAVDDQMKRQRAIDLTQDQIKALDRLQSAENAVDLAYQHLWQTITADLSKAGLASALEGLAEFTTYLSHNRLALTAVEVGIGAVATAITVTLITALLRLAAVLGLPALKILGGLSRPLALLGMGGAGAMAAGAAGLFLPDSMMPAGGVEARKGAWDAARGWMKGLVTGGGGASAGRVPTGGPGTGIGHVASQADRIAYARAYAISKGINPDAVVATMAGEGLGNYTGDHGTSFGDFQLHVGGGSMGDLAAAAGINIRDPNTWQAQHRFAIDQMAANRRKGADWYAGQWHGAPGWAAASFSSGGKGISPESIALGEQQAQSLSSQLRDRLSLPSAADEAELERRMDAGAGNRASRARARSANNSTINNRQISVGDVTVHTQATDANGIAQDLGGAIRRSVVNQANTGLV